MWEKRDTCLLPVTGQTTEYQSGDDGTYQAGSVGARFIDNGDGTVSDRHTGMMWVKEPGAIGGDFGSAGSPSTMTWANSIIESEGLTYAGLSDWRLPNAEELLSIRDFSIAAGDAFYQIFPSGASSFYWTSTTRAAVTGSAIAIQFNSVGSVITQAWDKTPTTYYLRPVRRGRFNA
jgi:hypothetical protein